MTSTDFEFASRPINEPLIQEIGTGGFLEGNRRDGRGSTGHYRSA